MSGRSPKQKGDRLERKIVKTLTEHGIEAHRVPLSGAVEGYPGDVVVTLPQGREVVLECKSRRQFKTLYSWLEHRDALIVKGDRQEPLAVIRLHDLLRLLGEP